MRWIIFPPLALLIVALAIANRGMVQLSLDPFDTIAPAITLDVPLIGIIFVSVLIGIVIGGLTGLGQAKKRRAKARKAAERAAIRSSANLPAALDI
ncbi:MAG: DUF1049 domain-containing protein [Parvibaculum sp.]